MLLGSDIVMLEEDPEEEDDKNSWKKRQNYIVRCTDAAWRRWKREYLTALRERHNIPHKTKVVKIDIGDVVMIKGEDKRRGKWKIGIVKKIISRERSRNTKCSNQDSKKCLERPIQCCTFSNFTAMNLHQITLFQELKKYQVMVIFKLNLTS